MGTTLAMNGGVPAYVPPTVSDGQSRHKRHSTPLADVMRAQPRSRQGSGSSNSSKTSTGSGVTGPSSRSSTPSYLPFDLSTTVEDLDDGDKCIVREYKVIAENG